MYQENIIIDQYKTKLTGVGEDQFRRVELAVNSPACF